MSQLHGRVSRDESHLNVTTYSLDRREKFVTRLNFDKLRIDLFSNGNLMLSVNPWDTLLVDNVAHFYSKPETQ